MMHALIMSRFLTNLSLHQLFSHLLICMNLGLDPQRAQTNSPVLKSYTVLYPEDGVTTDGSGGCGSSNDSFGECGAGCSVSTGHLSSFKDVNGGAAGSNNGRRSLIGGSDQGINISNTESKNNCSRSANSSSIRFTHNQQTGGVNQRKNSAASRDSNGNNANGEEFVDDLSSRQFHSLPRMSSNGSGGLSLFAPSSSSSSSAVARVLGLANKVGKRSFKRDAEKESKCLPLLIVYIFKTLLLASQGLNETVKLLSISTADYGIHFVKTLIQLTQNR